MNENDLINKQRSKERLAGLSFGIGIASLAGLVCCLPFMGIVGGIGLILAILSKGNDEKLYGKAKSGAIFSLIGMITSIVLTVMVVSVSFFDLVENTRRNPEYLDSVFSQYEELYESMGVEIPEEYHEGFDRIEEYINSYIEAH